jgi:hypothetical protein
MKNKIKRNITKINNSHDREHEHEHEHEHKNTKLFTCDGCEYKTKRMSDLRKHYKSKKHQRYLLSMESSRMSNEMKAGAHLPNENENLRTPSKAKAFEDLPSEAKEDDEDVNRNEDAPKPDILRTSIEIEYDQSVHQHDTYETSYTSYIYETQFKNAEQSEGGLSSSYVNLPYLPIIHEQEHEDEPEEYDIDIDMNVYYSFIRSIHRFKYTSVFIMGMIEYLIV